MEFQNSGFLSPGIVEMTRDKIFDELGFTPVRASIFMEFDCALKIIDVFKQGVSGVFVNGSFVSAMPDPGDIDVLIITDHESDAVSMAGQVSALNLPRLDLNVYHKDDPPAEGFLSFYGKMNKTKNPCIDGQKGFVRLIL
jgi:hypothetical protein